jgi:tetratricopeptide (TPR) repeat protein
LNYTFQRPHNDFLWILSQTGIIGFNLFVLFLFSVLVLFTKALRFIDTASFREAALCLSFIVGYYLISFFDFPMERIEHLIWIHILLALAYHHIRNTLQLKTFATIAVSRPVYMVALVLIVSISTLGVFRYQGELNTRRMYDAKKAGATIEIKKLGQSAKNFAYTIDPTSIPIDWYIGNANAALGNYPEAKKDFLKAYHYNPYNRNVLNDLASAYSVNHNTDSAKILYQEASRISPRFDDPKLNLAAIYIKEGNVEKTSECLENMYHDSPRRTQYQKIVEAMKKK